MLKVNRLTDFEGRTSPETAGPVNRAMIQDLHITALQYSTCQGKQTSAILHGSQHWAL